MKKILLLTYQLIILSTILSLSKGLAQNVGIGTATPNANALLHVDLATSTTKGLLVTGTYNFNSTVPDLAAGSRMMFYPGKAAFRVGSVTGTQWNDSVVGRYSVAMGLNTTASEWYSTAMGYNTTARGYSSTAIGNNTTASGYNSTAIGRNTTASFTYATAIGLGTTASGFASTAMGVVTTASASYSSALGYQTTAGGFYSTATGYQTIASGPTSFTTGGVTRAGGANSFASGAYTIAKGYASTVVGIYNDSLLTSDETLVTNTTPLFIVGNGNADNSRSNAMVVRKDGNVGIGISSPDATALIHVNPGTSTTKGLLVTGTYNSAATVPDLGAGSRMMFYPGKAAFRTGYVTVTQWDNSNVGFLSTAMGYNTTASGEQSIALGNSTTARGWNSTAIGGYTIASGNSSTAMGNSSTASGYFSTAMGLGTTASGNYSTSMGDHATASGYVSTAMGGYTTASGWYSTAMGADTRAKGYASTVVGMFNDSLLSSDETSVASTTPLFIVGNGSNSANRSNAMVVRKNGNVEVENLIVGGGTTLSKQQAGTTAVGSNASVLKTITVNFPSAFAGAPKIVATVKNQPGTDYGDVFVVSVRSVTTTSVTFNVLRVDTAAGWGQNLSVDWIAWE